MDSLTFGDLQPAEEFPWNKLLTAFGVYLLVTASLISGILLLCWIIHLCHLAFAPARVQQPAPFYVIYHADAEDADDGFHDGSVDALSEHG